MENILCYWSFTLAFIAFLHCICSTFLYLYNVQHLHHFIKCVFHHSWPMIFIYKSQLVITMCVIESYTPIKNHNECPLKILESNCHLEAHTTILPWQLHHNLYYFQKCWNFHLKENFSENNFLWKKMNNLLKYLEIFYFQNGILKINWLLDRNVFKLPRELWHLLAWEGRL